MIRKTATFLFVLAFSTVAVFAQEMPVVGESTINWVPPAGENGIEAQVRVKIVFDTFGGEPTEKSMARIESVGRIHFDGNIVTREQVGDRAFDRVEFGLINVLADIYQGSSFISTKRFDNLVSGDVAGSPNWDDVFPGVSAERAKSVFREGFTIRNIRLTEVNNYSFSLVEEALTRNANQQRFTEAVALAKSQEQEGDLDAALKSYLDAKNINQSDSFVNQRIPALQQMIIERNREANKAEQVADGDQQDSSNERNQAAQTDAEAKRVADQAAAQEEARRQAAARDAERRRQERERARQRQQTANGIGGIFDSGGGLYAMLSPLDIGAFSEETPGTNTFVGAGMIVGVMEQWGTASTEMMISDDTKIFVDGEDYHSKSYSGIGMGLGVKLSRSIVGNMVYPMIGLHIAGVTTTRTEESSIETLWTAYFYYGVRGHLGPIFWQYADHPQFKGKVLSIGIMPIGAWRKKRY